MSLCSHRADANPSIPTPRPSLPFAQALNPAWGEAGTGPQLGAEQGCFPGGRSRQSLGSKCSFPGSGCDTVRLFCAPPHAEGGAELPLPPPAHPCRRMRQEARRGSDSDSYLYFGPKLCIYTIFYVPFFVVTKMNILIR